MSEHSDEEWASSGDPQRAFRILRHLHRAAALWGERVALPISLLSDADSSARVRTLRILVQLEREGVVILQRAARAVCLTEPFATMGESTPKIG